MFTLDGGWAYFSDMSSTSGYVGAKYFQQFDPIRFDIFSASGYMGVKYFWKFVPEFLACRVPNVACHAVSIPFVSKSYVSCHVINLRVGVSVPCRGHPDLKRSNHEVTAWIQKNVICPQCSTVLMSGEADV